jgi:hypothetical protein
LRSQDSYWRPRRYLGCNTECESDSAPLHLCRSFTLAQGNP